MKSRKLWLLTALMLALALVLAACAGDGEPDDEPETTDDGNTDTEDDSTDDAASEGTGDLVIAIGSDIVSLSTHGSNDVPSSNVGENIYETLTKFDENGEIQPGLATWEEVDETTWDFFIEEGVTFHDGAALNAEAVKANFDRIVDEEIASPRAFLFEAVESTEVVDEYTLRINLAYPYAPLLSNLTHSGAAIMSPDVIAEDYAQLADGGDVDAYINQNPAGTGPFKYENWTPGESVVLVRNDDYWGEPAKLDSVTFKVVSEQSARIAELETNVSHIVDAIGPNNVSRVNGMDNANALEEPSVSLAYVGFNVQKEPFDDVRVRQAISMAIDKEQIIEGVYNGIGIPAVGPLAPPVFGYDENVSGLEYDLEAAQELLAEAGYADGFETTIWTNDNEQRVDTAVTIQAQLAQIGIDVQIEELEWGAYLDRTANGEHDMFILGWSVVTSDADYGMYPLFHSSAVGSTGNRSFLEDPELDAVLDEARKETDPAARQALYTEAQEMLVDLAPMLYLNHQEYLLGVNESVKDFWIDAQGIYKLKDTYIEQ
ncbi:glutathione ABC transporter substrate-binding protein [Oceanobacillus sp. CAU 1775]